MTRPILAAEFAASQAEIDNCWNRIGIAGDKTCPLLAQHSHCRNCPTFSRAAAALLDRDLAGEPAVADRGEFGAASGRAETQTDRAVIFRIGCEWFGLPTTALDEIIGLRPIHSLPHRRNSGLVGLINLRGELVICVSPSELLGGGAAGPCPQARLLVVRPRGGRLALPVDEVLQIHHFARGELQPLPVTVARSPSRFSKALLPHADKMIGMLDEQALFEALQRMLT